eukprot:GILK01001945.1.p1 GENE.GILK01001945.1~~GILK01001945.1.p1  ORF type:complete len:378 (-),score=32.13 GILK01001945.1:180-1313(-)
MAFVGLWLALLCVGVVVPACVSQSIFRTTPSDSNELIEPFPMFPFLGPIFSNGLLNHEAHPKRQHAFPFPEGHECEEDARRLCKGIVRLCGSGSCALQCLAEHAPNISAECRAVHPCAPYIAEYCEDVTGGHGRMMECLKPHVKDISDECKKHNPCLTSDTPCIGSVNAAPLSPADQVLKDLSELGGVFKSILGDEPKERAEGGDDFASFKEVPDRNWRNFGRSVEREQEPRGHKFLVDKARQEKRIRQQEEELARERDEIDRERKHLDEVVAEVKSEKEKIKMESERLATSRFVEEDNSAENDAAAGAERNRKFKKLKQKSEAITDEASLTSHVNSSAAGLSWSAPHSLCLVVPLAVGLVMLRWAHILPSCTARSA